MRTFDNQVQNAITNQSKVKIAKHGKHVARDKRGRTRRPRHEPDLLKNIVIDRIGSNTLDAILSDNQAQQSMRLISTIKG